VNIRLATWFLITAAIGGEGLAAQMAQADVYLSDRDDSGQLLCAGKAVAAEIFARSGVQLVWRSRELPNAKGAGRQEFARLAFGIRTLERAPDTLGDAVVATTRIVNFQGKEITIYADRLTRLISRRGDLAQVAAGYVLAHELAHAMQGIARHSETGILKASWSNEDYQQMVWRKLGFTPMDVELIHRGIAFQLANAQSGPADIGNAVLTMGFRWR